MRGATLSGEEVADVLSLSLLRARMRVVRVLIPDAGLELVEVEVETAVEEETAVEVVDFLVETGTVVVLLVTGLVFFSFIADARVEAAELGANGLDADTGAILTAFFELLDRVVAAVDNRFLAVLGAAAFDRVRLFNAAAVFGTPCDEVVRTTARDPWCFWWTSFMFFANLSRSSGLKLVLKSILRATTPTIRALPERPFSKRLVS